jgi:ATP-binding cassette subfamily B protein
VTSDLQQNGHYGMDSLVVAEDQLLICSEEPAILTRLAFSDITELKIRALVGHSVLEAVHEEFHTPLLSFSDARSVDFNQAVEDVNAWLKGEELRERSEEERRKICRQCNKPIPHQMNTCPRCVNRRRVIRSLWHFIRPHRHQVGFLLLTMIGGTMAGLLTPYMSKVLIDDVFQKDAAGAFPHAPDLMIVILIMIIAHVGMAVLGGLQHRISGTLGFVTVSEVRDTVYRKLQAMSMSFFDKHQTGALLARVNQDTQNMQNLLVDFTPALIECSFMFVGIGILLFVLSWQLTLFVLLPIVAIVVLLKTVLPSFFRQFHRFFHRRGKLSAIVSDSLNAIRVVKAFGQGHEEIRKFDEGNTAFCESGINLVRRMSILHPTMHFLVMSGSIIVWYVGGRLIFDGEMSLGSVVAYAGYLAMFYRPVFVLTRLTDMMANALSASERVFEVIDAKPDVLDSDEAQAMPALRGDLHFKDVTFGYDRYKPVLKEINIKIEANEMIGLVGKSGVGKSTFINLVCRLYDVNQGTITIDGVDLRRVRQEDLRSQIGIVLQETLLFSGTIFDNIRYARPEATRTEVIAAAMAANAHDFIRRKPDGYDSQVGEKGGKLSGGEKQRLSIARAILRDPRILILDEATSSVDTETEQHIQTALAKLVKGRTTLVIAHRLSTLKNCDRLIVFKDGEIAETGTHEELLAQEGIFHGLVEAQRELSSLVAVKG